MQDIKPEVFVRDMSYIRDHISHDVEISYPFNGTVMTVTFDCDSSGVVSVLVWDDNQVRTLDKSVLANRVTLDD
jgi:hypothetical protein